MPHETLVDKVAKYLKAQPNTISDTLKAARVKVFSSPQEYGTERQKQLGNPRFSEGVGLGWQRVTLKIREQEQTIDNNMIARHERMRPKAI